MEKLYKPSEELENSIAIENLNTSMSDFNRKDIQAMEKSSEAYRKMYAIDQNEFLTKIKCFWKL